MYSRMLRFHDSSWLWDAWAGGSESGAIYSISWSLNFLAWEMGMLSTSCLCPGPCHHTFPAMTAFPETVSQSLLEVALVKSLVASMRLIKHFFLFWLLEHTLRGWSRGSRVKMWTGFRSNHPQSIRPTPLQRWSLHHEFWEGWWWLRWGEARER